jgi:hypothetical protein
MDIQNVIRMAAVRLNSTDRAVITEELKKAGFLYTEKLVESVLSQIDCERVEGQVSYVSALSKESRERILSARVK